MLEGAKSAAASQFFFCGFTPCGEKEERALIWRNKHFEAEKEEEEPREQGKLSLFNILYFATLLFPCSW